MREPRRQLAVLRAVFYDIYPGDRLKLDAQSNVADTGGGARDFRFSPVEEFFPLFGLMLPDREVRTTRGRVAGEREVEVLVGNVRWTDAAAQPNERQGRMTIWPANERRTTEARIGTVHKFGVSHLVLDDPNGGKSVFLLLQMANGELRMWFTTETSLRAHPERN